MNQLANVGDFCPYEACPDYGKLQKKQSKQNIKEHGFTAAGIQRFQCRTCGQTFTTTKGTPFYRRRTDPDEILETLAFLAEAAPGGCCPRPSLVITNTSNGLCFD